jgi:hypothetical protein
MIVCIQEVTSDREAKMLFIDTEKLDPKDPYRIEVERVLSKPTSRPGGHVGSIWWQHAVYYGDSEGTRYAAVKVDLPATVQGSMEMYLTE